MNSMSLRIKNKLLLFLSLIFSISYHFLILILWSVKLFKASHTRCFKSWYHSCNCKLEYLDSREGPYGFHFYSLLASKISMGKGWVHCEFFFIGFKQSLLLFLSAYKSMLHIILDFTWPSGKFTWISSIVCPYG